MSKEPNPQEQQPPQEPIENIVPASDEPVIQQPITESEPINTQPENKDMEVHHHAHHGHEKKTWKSYFWEFFMLFTAVFCGSLAELQLEHYIEHKREKQYIESMVHDIIEDTIKMRIGIDLNTIKIAGMDSLISSILTTPYTDSSLKRIYQLTNYLHYRKEVFFTKRTITQLKNSGGLRLIRNMAVSDSIVSYDETCERIEKQFDNLLWHQLKARDFEFKIFDPHFIYTIAHDKKYSLLNNDEKLMMEYVSWVGMTKNSHANYVTILNYQTARAKSTIEFLQKEYHPTHE